MPTRNIKWYGWRPDVPDHRDYRYAAPRRVLKALPPGVDLRPQCPDVLDQGNLGSCTANAIGSLDHFVQMKQGLAAFSPSRLFIYYNERVMEGSVNEDAGAEIRDGMKSISVRGVCPETMWPYAVSKFNTKPPKKCFTEALRHQAVQYMRVGQTLDQLKGCLSEGYPFVFGFTVFDSFESDRMAKTGMMPMPKKTEQNLGGHAVMAVGYSEAKKRFLVRNSWGTDWALKGYFWMPYAYMTSSDLADDFWTLRTVET